MGAEERSLAYRIRANRIGMAATYSPSRMARNGAARRPARSGMWLSLATLVLLAHGSSALAAARFVAPSGNDANAGSISQPWRTVSSAFGKLAAGDTLYIRAGSYFESPVMSRSGTASKPIVVRAYPGERVVLDSGYPELQTPGNSEWELVDAATGEYRTKRSRSTSDIYAYVAGIPGYENERVALVPYASADHFRATTDQYNATAFYVGPGTLKNSDGRVHVRLAKTNDMRAIEARYGQVFASDLPNPSDYSIVLSQSSHTLRVAGSYLVFKDLILNQAKRTIYLAGGVHDLRFEGMTVWMGNRCVSVTAAGVHHVTMTGCKMYGDAPLWVFWSDMKDSPAPADLARGTSIDLRYGTHDWEIAYCHIRGSGQDLIGTNQNEYNVSIHHNRIENAADDALELEGTENVGRIEVHDNYIANCLTAVAPGQDTPRFDGPLLVYRNVCVLLRDPPINRAEGINTWNGGGRFGFEYMFKHSTSASYSTRNTHYYHNTLVLLNSPGRGMNITPKFAENTRIANNLMVTVNGKVNGTYQTGAGQVLDGNLYWKMNTVDSEPLLDRYDTVAQFTAATQLESHGVGGSSKRGTDPGFASFALDIVDRTRSKWSVTPTSEVHGPADFMLSASSPARGAGIAIPAHPEFGALPDSRNSRDIGAIPFGTPASEFDVFPFDLVSVPIVDPPAEDPPGDPPPSDPPPTDPPADDPPQSSVIEQRILSGADDAEESASGSVSMSSSDLELSFDGSLQTVGLRFTDLQIPKGATIGRAYVQFTTDETGADASQLTIHAQATDDAPVFSATRTDVSGRGRTSASVDWSPPAWTVVGEAGEAQRTPDLSALIQEVIDRASWSSGNALVLIVTGSGRRTAEAFDGDQDAAPVLHIELASQTVAAPAGGGPTDIRPILAPNPMRDSASLRFWTQQAGPVKIRLFDVNGRQIRTIIDTPNLPAGNHRVDLKAWGHDGFVAGVYFYRVETKEQVSRGRFLVVD